MISQTEAEKQRFKFPHAADAASSWQGAGLEQLSSCQAYCDENKLGWPRRVTTSLRRAHLVVFQLPS